MPVTGTIEGWDLGWRAGFASGIPGGPVRSGAVELKATKEWDGQGYGNFVALIQDRWRDDKPELVVAEAPMELGAIFTKKMSAESFIVHYTLHGILKAMCSRYRVRYVAVHQATARHHFLGFANLGDRTATNNAVVNRCRLMKLVPPDCTDWDRCSAICIHDYGCAHFGRRSTSIQTLYLTGEGQ